MPQARLPDINTEFITYRNEARNSLKSKKYDSMFGAAFAINAMLPENYRVQISSRQYEELEKQAVMAVCTYCQEEKKYEDLKVFKKLLSPFESFLAKTDSIEIWKCDKCGSNNKIAKTKLKQKVRKRPYFLRVVPDPPERKDGIMDGRMYHKKVSKWFWQFMDELANQEAKFREDYTPKGSEFEDEGIEAGGEEE